MRRSVLSLAPLALAGLIGCEKQPHEIKVKAPQASVHSVRADPVLAPFERKGDTIKLRTSAFAEDGSYMGTPKAVKWSSTDESVATVAPDGLVTIVASGKTEIVAKTEGYEKVLEGRLPVSAVIIDKVEIVPPAEGFVNGNQFHLGEFVKLDAKVYDDRGNVIPDAKVTWRNLGWAATVAVNGEIEARAIGKGQIMAEAGPHSAKFEIEVLDWKKPSKRRR
jgi:hypothetical protein